ncbi:MAG: HD domain-containing protein [Cyanobacteria bacterium]|nr:HD domain-containing protein [Cyanobacteriota bacterium]
MNRFQEALIYAAQLHQTQLRKGTSTPYLSHLMAVSSIVMEYGGNEDEAIAGLLHDAVEDQGGLPVLAEIRRRFGDTVADIVYGCTDAEVIPKPPWKERKVAYIQHLETATPSTLLVSASDKLHNVRNILSDYRKKGEQTWSLFKGGKEGTLWYYRALLTVFERKAQSQQVSPDLIQELGRCVETLEKLSKTTP